VSVRRGSSESLRGAAVWVVERTLSTGAGVDAFLPGVLERLEERDQRLLRELVLGTLRWLRRLDHVIEQASSRSLDQIEVPLLPVLRVAVYQLLFLDRMPSHPVVDEAVELAHQRSHRGAASFVNAVLRRIARERSLEAWPVEEPDPVRRLAIEWSHPDFLVQGWVQRFGAERTRRLLEDNNRPKPFHVLGFSDRGGRYELAEQLIEDGVVVEPSLISAMGLVVRDGNPLASRAFAQGDLYVADEAGQAAAWIPPPRPGERILDLAAAPGGKSIALLALEPSVRITAADSDPARLALLRSNFDRLGRKVQLYAGDARVPPLARADFDRVVIDLPCSGTGTLRKHPELKWRLSPEELRRQASRGRALLEGAATCVAPGGLLVAITCSIEDEENEAVVDAFLEGHPDFGLEPLGEALAGAVVGGVEGPGRWRMLPAEDHDGFTVHVLRRKPRDGVQSSPK
jgi:16S rRNA (cytosine967-C5)-methyltransferase